MAQFLQIHPDNPQGRLISTAVQIIREGGVIAYPTDSCYALGCRLGDKAASDQIRRIRNADRNHAFTLVCQDLSEIASYAKVDNWAYRLVRSLTPGPYTFVLRATREVPKRLQHPRRKTIGIRVPDHAITQVLLAELGEPIMSSTLSLPGDNYPLTDAEEIRGRLEQDIAAVIDGGPCAIEPTSIIDLEGGSPVVIRRGKGDVSMFES